MGCVASSRLARIFGKSFNNCSFFLNSSSLASLVFSACSNLSLKSLRSCSVYSMKVNELVKSEPCSEMPLLNSASLDSPKLSVPISVAFSMTLSSSGVLNS